jgi:glycosyltransferase involved in cell wall biosynthesis
MASQKAVLVSSCAALTEIVRDGYNGFVFQKGDVHSLMSALKTLILDNALRERVAYLGRKWVSAERDWSISSSKIIKLYDWLRKD